jgi:hypothetical protein
MFDGMARDRSPFQIPIKANAVSSHQGAMSTITRGINGPDSLLTNITITVFCFSQITTPNFRFILTTITIGLAFHRTLKYAARNLNYCGTGDDSDRKTSKKQPFLRGKSRRIEIQFHSWGANLTRQP